ncbi:MAG TPA: hypothetical protein VKB77_09960, partial [Terriglobales bacterium]|nr:hypothetical protein [Terriglobales bacterium]
EHRRQPSTLPPCTRARSGGFCENGGMIASVRYVWTSGIFQDVRPAAPKYRTYRRAKSHGRTDLMREP